MFSESQTIQELGDFGQHYAVGDDPIPRESHIVARHPSGTAGH